VATYESKKYGTIPVAATQIADGSVTNSEYQFINSLSSNAQTQITALDTAKLNLAGGTITGNVTITDNDHLYIGNGQDIDVFSDGSTGFIKGNDLRMQSSTSENYITAAVNGATKLFYDNSQKLETTSAGATISGTLTATTFSGSGASLTSLPAGNLTGTVADARISTLTASKLTGALPAIDGSNLTGIDVVPSAADVVGAIRSFALFSASTGTPTDTIISPGTSLTPASYSSGSGSSALQLMIDPPVLSPIGNTRVVSPLGFQVTGIRYINGKTRTTVSGTWRTITEGSFRSAPASGGPGGTASAATTGFLAQRIS
tara:strand:+ start:1475 stop:2425 length:951 start_codon:yes stop_codon:yes gene_type:complete